MAARGKRPFAAVDDLWRRAGVPVVSLVRLAQADALRRALGLARREALWALRGLRDAPLPLFEAASRQEERAGGVAAPEAVEPATALSATRAGREVVEDHRHTGLSLRSRPVSFLRGDLARRRALACAEAARLRDRSPVRLAGLVLVRQKPGSAKSVLFITLEDETGVANLVVWPGLFEARRRVVLASRLLGVDGRVQREGEVVHVVAHRLHDLSGLLDGLGERDAGATSMPGGRDGGPGGGGPDAHGAGPGGPKVRDIFILDPSPEAIRTKTRDFR